MQTYLITGANRGLGLEFVRQLIERGDRVIACCREPAKAAELQVLDGPHGRLTILALDVADPAAIAALPGELAGETLDVLVNNAGVAAAQEGFGHIEAGTMEHILRVNSVAPMLLVQALAPLMQRGGKQPKIVCITSSLGSITQASDLSFGLSYGMSKAALNMGVKKMSSEMARRGITIITLHPGWVQTDMGGKNATLQPRESIAGMLKVMDGLKESDNGRYLTYAGEELPW